MPQCPPYEFARVPLRAHAFLADVPLHDAWAVDLPRRVGDVTLAGFLRRTGGAAFAPSAAVRMLVAMRLAIGRVLGWDGGRRAADTPQPTFADRLTAADRMASVVPVGTRDGPFRVVYRFKNEQLAEIANATAHAAALTTIVETPRGYRYYLAVYVRRVSWVTPLYLAAIDPFRKLIVYPSLLRGVRAAWDRAATEADADS